MQSDRFRLWSFSGRFRILHLAWFAFFLSFVLWFNAAPLLGEIRNRFGLSKEEVSLLMILNVALAIPARVIIGAFVDRLGPRLLFSLLLSIAGILCFLFAWAESFSQLAWSRFLLGVIGAGFVIGIRLIAEWFPAREVGMAEGIYGGWGNFGSAFAAMTLPAIAAWFGGENGWRWALSLTGLIAIAYSFVFYRLARNHPQGTTYFRPKRIGAIEVASRGDLMLYLAVQTIPYLAVGLLIWKIGEGGLHVISALQQRILWLGLGILYLYQALYALRMHAHLSRPKTASASQATVHYRFSQVAVLAFSYFAAFGSELAVVSMLPLFFQDTFSLSPTTAGLLASGFALMNLVSRPAGGWFSDRFGRRKSLALLLLGMAIGYGLLAQIDASTPPMLAAILAMACSFFVQGAEGAVFAVVPLIQRRLTGQFAGLVGAYGNAGALAFLTVLSFVSPTSFFVMLAAVALVASVVVFVLLKDPKGYIYERNEDGTLERIHVG